MGHRRLPAALILGLVLLLAQLAAQAHAYTRLQSERGDTLSRHCTECCLSASLLGHATPPCAQTLPRSQGVTPWIQPVEQQLHTGFRTPSFRSRAPPHAP
jgi:hypothetical protein